MAKLKVYRTAIGFHDAYVAAPSQKAALAAWGSDANLFTRGIAEQVDDPASTREALARPGVVIKKLRGTVDEQLAALPKDAVKPEPRRAAVKSAKTKAAPRPSRKAMVNAEEELKRLRERQAEEEQALAAKEKELAAERRALAARHGKEIDRIEKRIESARKTFEAAMAKWRE